MLYREALVLGLLDKLAVLVKVVALEREQPLCSHLLFAFLLSASVSIRQHPSAYVEREEPLCSLLLFAFLLSAAYVSIRQHPSAYVVKREEPLCSLLLFAFLLSASVSIRQHPSASVSIRQHPSASVSIRQHPSASVSIRQHTCLLRVPHSDGLADLLTPALQSVVLPVQVAVRLSSMRTHIYLYLV
jgi:hypothetical protein